MNKSAVLLSALLSLGAFVSLRAQEPAKPAATSVADKDYQAYQDLAKRQPPKPAAQMSNREKMEFSETLAQDRRSLALAFIEKHPTDARRWAIVNGLNPLSPRFVKEYGDADAKGVPATIIDEPAATAWKATVAGLKGAMAKAADVPAEVTEQMAWGEFAAAFRATTTAKSKGEPFDYAPFRARYDAHVAKFGKLPNMPARALDYLGALESSMPGASLAEWEHLRGTPNALLRAKAAERVANLPKEIVEKQQAKERVAGLMSKPFELAFTAVDGRAVDMKKLRGKVVLIDFWATWCGPCIAELPNVKRVYEAYHDKGFEIIGISLDRENDLEKLNDFTAREKMTWPQHFDGGYWKNEIAVRYDIRAIPAMFLIDQEGIIVSKSARGPALESEVKRLLKL